MLLTSERKIQVEVIKWRNANLNVFPELGLLHAIPNGGYRLPIEGVNLKRAGVVSGIPDLHLPVARLGYHGLWIELKSEHGILSENQRSIMQALIREGHIACVCYNAASAIDLISNYLNSVEILFIGTQSPPDNFTYIPSVK